jgi:hypothetical protein
MVVAIAFGATPDTVDESSNKALDTNTGDIDGDADTAPGDPSQKCDPCDCVGDGVPDSWTVTVDVIVFTVGAAPLRAGAEEAWAPLPFSSRV